MKRWVIVLGTLMLSALRFSGQEYPQIEFFGGGSLESTNIIGRQTISGWQIGAAFNPHKRLRLVGDFGGQHQDTSIRWQGQPITMRSYQVLFGPQVTWRRSKVTWFAHPLVGVAAAHFVTPSRDIPAVDFGFATALGGGADVNLGHFFAIRAIQADYLLSHLRPELPSISPLAGSLPTLGNWQSNLRLGFGLVVRFADHPSK